MILLKVWHPSDVRTNEALRHSHSGSTVFRAWTPYIFLVLLVLMIGYDPIKNFLNQWSAQIPWPGLHNQILRVPPAVKAAGPYAALFNFNFFTAPGTATMVACFLAALSSRDVRRAVWKIRGRRGPAVGVAFGDRCFRARACVSFELLRCDRDSRTGIRGDRCHVPVLQFAPGWLGVFLTGSDTSANALFGNLQVRNRRTPQSQPGIDGSLQLERRRNGQNDQPAKYRSGCRSIRNAFER